jgi:hypothetical protein
MKRNTILSAKCVASVVMLAGLALVGAGKAHATSEPEYKPAYLVHGYCGHGTLDIKVHGKKETVQCANLDTYTGRGYYERKHCYKKYKSHGHWNKHGHYGYYEHCETKKYYYQLPVLSIEKIAYDKYHKVIATSHSKAYDFHVSTNGG